MNLATLHSTASFDQVLVLFSITTSEANVSGCLNDDLRARLSYVGGNKKQSQLGSRLGFQDTYAFIYTYMPGKNIDAHVYVHIVLCIALYLYDHRTYLYISCARVS